MSNLSLIGEIVDIHQTEEVSDSFKKRNLIIKTEGQYSQTLLIEFVQDKVDILDNYIVGEKVEVFFNIRGRVYEDKGGVKKYFTSLSGWKVE